MFLFLKSTAYSPTSIASFSFIHNISLYYLLSFVHSIFLHCFALLLTLLLHLLLSLLLLLWLLLTHGNLENVDNIRELWIDDIGSANIPVRKELAKGIVGAGGTDQVGVSNE